MEKVTSLGFVVGLAKRRVLFAGAIAAAVALVGTKVLADSAADIESGAYAPNSAITYDNYSGAYPVITALASQPGTFGGHLYSTWSLLAQDLGGSLDLYTYVDSITNLNGAAGLGTPYTRTLTPAVGDAVNAAGNWAPYHQIPEVTFSTVASSNNYINRISTGNVVPTPVFTVSSLNVPTLPENIAGYFLEIQNATISGSTGSFNSTFPTYAQANITSESYTITDGSGSMTMFDWVTSYSADGALGGTPVIAGAVNVYGFMSVNTGGPTEFIPLQIVSVPEPSSVALVVVGLLGLLAMRRRK